MDVNDTAEHDVCVAVGYDLCDLAFEMRFGLGDANRSYRRRGCRVSNDGGTEGSNPASSSGESSGELRNWLSQLLPGEAARG